MKKTAAMSERSQPPEAPNGADFFLPTLDECRRDDRLKERLLRIEQNIQVAHNRLIADAARGGIDERFVYSASATVILSIAASMMEFAAHRVGKPLDPAVFVEAARAAALDGKRRRPTDKQPVKIR